MPEDIGTNSDAATFEIVGNLIGIFLLSSMYIASHYIIFHPLLMKFSCFRNKNRYIRCFMTVLVILLTMQILNSWFCPVFTNNFQLYIPRSCFELFVQFFVIAIIICLTGVISLSLLKFSINSYCLYTNIVLSIILIIYLIICNTCSTLNVIFEMLKELY